MEKFWLLISSNIFLSPLLFSCFGTSIIYILDLLTVSHRSLKLCGYFFLSFHFFLVFSLSFYFIYLYYLFLAALGLRWVFARAFSSCGEQGLLFVVVHGLLIVVASLVAEHGL